MLAAAAVVVVVWVGMVVVYGVGLGFGFGMCLFELSVDGRVCGMIMFIGKC